LIVETEEGNPRGLGCSQTLRGDLGKCLSAESLDALALFIVNVRQSNEHQDNLAAR
jgi:hypothetical protein